MVETSFLDEDEDPKEFHRNLLFTLIMVGIIILMIVGHRGCPSPVGTFLVKNRAILKTPGTLDMPYVTYDVNYEDNTFVRAWYIPKQEPEKPKRDAFSDFFYRYDTEPELQKPGGSIILFGDGIHSKADYLSYARILTQKGYDLFLFDFRGIGESEGKLNLENALEDSLQIVQKAQDRKRNDSIACYGFGLGANLALETACRLKEKKEIALRAVILESPLPDLESFRNNRSTGPSSLLRNLLKSAQIEYPSSLDVIEQLPSLPIFFIQSSSDNKSLNTLIGLYHRKKGLKDFWYVPSLSLDEGSQVYPLELSTQLDEFLAPFLLKRGIWKPSFEIQTQSTEDEKTQVSFHLASGLFDSQESSSPIPVEVFFLTQKGPLLERLWVEKQNPSLLYTLDQPPLMAAIKKIDSIEPLAVPYEKGYFHTFDLSRCQTRQQYMNRMIYLRGESQRLASLYEFARKKMESENSTEHTQLLLDAKKNLTAGQLDIARNSIHQALSGIQPIASFEPDRENGIHLLENTRCPENGKPKKTRVGTQSAISTQIDQGGYCLYFDIDNEILRSSQGNLAGIEVEYLDAGHDQFCLAYDSQDRHAPVHRGNLKLTRWITKSGTGQWKKELFLFTDAQFANRGPGESDFSLWSLDYSSSPQNEIIASIRLYTYP